MPGYAAEAFTQAVDVVESLHELTIALLIYTAQGSAIGRSKLFDTIQHTGLGLVFLADFALGYTAIKHLVQVVRIGVHEDGLSRTAGRELRNRGLDRHALHGVHADAEMRQQRLRQDLAQFIIDRRCSRRRTVTTAIAAQRAEEGAVVRIGVHAVQTVNYVQTLLVRLQSLYGFGQFRLSKGTTVFHARGNSRRRIEPLVLHEENDALGRATTSRPRRLSHAGQHRGPSKRCCGNSLKHFSSIDHSPFQIRHNYTFRCLDSRICSVNPKQAL